MNAQRIMVVDDEQLNLFIIEEFLSEQGYELALHADPLVARDALFADPQGYALLVLDRMMPGLDGMDFLRQVKSDRRFDAMPVIMQTAASSPDQVREGLEAGAFYYLTKPYEPEALISIVRAALEDQRARDELRHKVASQQDAQRLLQTVTYRFVTLADVATLVPVLSALCPVPESVAPGLSDLMVNAVEHGNLGLTYQEKSRLKWEGDWEGELTRRLALPDYKDRVATVVANLTAAGEVTFTITDQGAGFDWQKFLDFDPDRAFDPNGRGIAMARMMSFSSIEYRGCGNVVVATVSAAPLAAV